MNRIVVAILGLISPMVLFAGPVDINSADAETIARELNGVGAARARAIVEYREKNGDFRSPEEVLNVSGIGQHIFEANQDNIIVRKSGE
jgi:competence protein ComEA